VEQSSAWVFGWGALTSIASVASAVVVITAAAIALRQVREAARARRLQSGLAILEHVSGSHDIRNARRLTYTERDLIAEKLKMDPSWTELDEFFLEISDGKVDFQIFHTYHASLENISMLTMHDMAPDDLISMYLGRMAFRHWEAMGPFILFMRRRYNSDDFLQHFEMLIKLMQRDGLRQTRNTRGLSLKHVWRIITNYSGRTKRKILSERYMARSRADHDKLMTLQYYHAERLDDE
jgi:hypothetical protein